MTSDAFFELSPYHLALALIGAIVVLASWLPRLVTSQEPAAAPLMILLGAGAAWSYSRRRSSCRTRGRRPCPGRC